MRHVLAMTPDELGQVLGAVLEYNGKHLLSVHLCGASGEDLPVSSIEIEYDGEPLLVRTQREPSPLEKGMAITRNPLDPHKVEPPLPIEDLLKMSLAVHDGS